MKDIKQEFVFGAIDFDNKIDAIDQLGVVIYTLRGVSDSLLVLSGQSHDYQDVMRMLSDITVYESQVLSRVEAIMEKELSTTLEVKSLKT